MYKQPNVPVQHQESARDFFHILVMFLKDFTADVWKHDAEQEKVIQELRDRISALEGE